MNEEFSIVLLITPKCTLKFLYDDCTIRQGIEKIRDTGYTAIPVISRKTGEYVGTVSEGDFLWDIVDRKDYYGLKDLEDESILNIVNKEKYKAVHIDTHINDLVAVILNQNFVPLVDDRGCFMGIITRRRVIEHYSQHHDVYGY